jgi:hypothetical protein
MKAGREISRTDAAPGRTGHVHGTDSGMADKADRIAYLLTFKAQG